MRPLAALEAAIDDASPDEVLAIGEEILEHWVVARGATPTGDTREGFRLLALHRQGAQGDPSFNACRETCRELAYYYNLVTLQPDAAETTHRAEMLKMICRHLYLFISGKLQVAGLGDFCCSSRPIRLADDTTRQPTKEG